MYPYHRLHAVEMATSSMGQGFNTTTIQMLNGYAALINGGNLRRPYLVSHIVDSNGHFVHETEPTVVRRVISEETSDFIRNEMSYVVSMRPGVGDFTGTGWRSHIPGYNIGGKTGTAQQGVRGSGEYIPTFIAFLPVENPRYLVLLTIDRIANEDNRYASTTIAPIMREFLVELIRLKNIPPSGDIEVTAPEIMGAPMPNFEGLRLADAVRDVVNIGMGGYHVVGGGTVISHHWPAPGHPIPETSPIIFYTDKDTRISERMVVVPTVAGLSADTANHLLQGAGLPAVLFTNRNESANTNESHPITSGPEPIGEAGTAAPASLPYIIYQQFPMAGSEVEAGTQVILRAR
jgi:stage V sporulation protein D (sporulation-specific penicillin-binding protein)